MGNRNRWTRATVNTIFPRGWLCNCTENGCSQVHFVIAPNKHTWLIRLNQTRDWFARWTPVNELIAPFMAIPFPSALLWVFLSFILSFVFPLFICFSFFPPRRCSIRRHTEMIRYSDEITRVSSNFTTRDPVRDLIIAIYNIETRRFRGAY